jgi:integrase
MRVTAVRKKKQVQLSEEGVARYKTPAGGQDDYFDTVVPGLVLRVNYGGAKVWLVRHYLKRTDEAGKRYLVPTTHRLGRYPVLKVKEARERARFFQGDVQKGRAQAKADTFQAVAENFIKRYVEDKGLRSQPEIERCLKKYVYPEWSAERFRAIDREQVANLLDKIVDENGPVQADRVLAIIRKLMNWYATRANDYTSPIVRGMNRSSGKDRARKRVLSDDEIRALWQTTEDEGTFGAMLRVALLTAQRIGKVVTMQWDDIVDGKWRIASEDGEKGNAEVLPLPPMVLEIIAAQPRLAANPYVFVAGHGDGHFNSFSLRKEALDKQLAFTKPWTIHDLRRTARTLMSQCPDILYDVAERVLGHKRQGVEPVYDRHDYTHEKGAALRSLAAKVNLIVNPPPKGKVARLDEHRGKRKRAATR